MCVQARNSADSSRTWITAAKSDSMENAHKVIINKAEAISCQIIWLHISLCLVGHTQYWSIQLFWTGVSLTINSYLFTDIVLFVTNPDPDLLIDEENPPKI